MQLLQALFLTIIFGAISSNAGVIRNARANRRRVKAHVHQKEIKTKYSHPNGLASPDDLLNFYKINGKIPDNRLAQILGRARDIVRNKLQPIASDLIHGIRHSVGKRSISKRSVSKRSFSRGRRSNTVEIDAETLALLLAAHGDKLDEVLNMIVAGTQDSTANTLQESLSNVIGSTDYIAIAHAIG
ncbi:uncharacterized protein LOC135494957 [Lineus longissimus]|uniref:uncharacterized protein LOC135494957 n=1 Tax=Lineus longissimus TaxID=88925 RepID=UPI002B4D5D31